MSWASKLQQTYDNNLHMVGKETDDVMLAPLAHMNARAQIEVLINLDGSFLRASKIDKEDEVTMIPVTESSAGRASGIAPHPLCDTLSYIAGDYCDYVSDKEAEKSSEKFDSYIKELKNWKESTKSHDVVRAVYYYLSNKTLIKDLIHSDIVKLDQDGKLSNEKINGVAYEKVIVRFQVTGGEVDNTYLVGKDASLFQAYVEYYVSSMDGLKEMCYLSGKMQTIATNHPKGIVSSNYGAKLISANDSQGFTYRGRFEKPEEASVIGYDTTQRVHNTLTWLVKKQGISFGNTEKRTYVCWNPIGKRVPEIELDFDVYDGEEEDSYTEESYKMKLYKTLEGYKNELIDNDDIIVIGLDAATTGRLSITYYNELSASDFLNRIELWYEECSWYFNIYHNDKFKILVQSIRIRDIVRCAYGTEQGKFLEVNDRIMKEQSQRLIHCMLNRKPISYELVHAIYNKASIPTAYSRGNWEKILSTACALIKKYKSEKMKGGHISMTIDFENRDRSYLFGRLLAVLERVERSTYERGEKREPNAIRLWNAYVNHPGKTWQTLEDLLVPYYAKLMPGSRSYYKNIIGEIISKLEQEDMHSLNRKLDENYLIGYYLQRMELRKYYVEGNGEEDENAGE